MDRQLDALKLAGAEEIIQEKITGTKADRPELNRLLGKLKKGAYDPAGDVLEDTDWSHGGTGHVFPHRHGWENGIRDKIGVPFQGPPPPPSSTSGWIVAGIVLYWVVSEGSIIF